MHLDGGAAAIQSKLLFPVVNHTTGPSIPSAPTPVMTSSLLRYVTIVILSAAILACGDDEDYAHFGLDDGAELAECFDDAFPFEPDFLSAKTDRDRTGIFLQSRRDVNYRSDVVLIQLYDVDPSEGPVELSPTTDEAASARAKMAFFSSCPDEVDTFELRGMVEFDRFELDGGIISGRLVDAYAVDARSGESVIDSVSGSFRLPVRRGVPHQDFFALP